MARTLPAIMAASVRAADVRASHCRGGRHRALLSLRVTITDGEFFLTSGFFLLWSRCSVHRGAHFARRREGGAGCGTRERGLTRATFPGGARVASRRTMAPPGPTAVEGEKPERRVARRKARGAASQAAPKARLAPGSPGAFSGQARG